MTSGIIPYYKGFRSSCFVYAHRIVSCMLKDENGVSHDSHRFHPRQYCFCLEAISLEQK